MTDLPVEPIHTRIAYAGEDDHHYCGYRNFGELLGKKGFYDLVALACGPVELTEDDHRALDVLVVGLNAADARIWPLKVVRLAASFGNPLVGMAASHMVLNSEIIGPWIIHRAAEALMTLGNSLRGRLDDESFVLQTVRAYLAKHRKILGFGVPMRTFDERVVAVTPVLASLGRTSRYYFSVYEKIAQVLKNERNLQPNIGIVVAAVLVDLGFAPMQTALMSIMLQQNVFVAHALEGAIQKASVLQKLPDVSVIDATPAARLSPRAQAALKQPA